MLGARQAGATQIGLVAFWWHGNLRCHREKARLWSCRGTVLPCKMAGLEALPYTLGNATPVAPCLVNRFKLVYPPHPGSFFKVVGKHRKGV